MKNVKMIILDLDRTLLHTDKVISGYTQQTLAECARQGMKIVFATARPMREVHGFLKIVPCDAVIYHNGAGVLLSGRLIYSALIPIATARLLLTICTAEFPEIRLSVEINDFLYANFDTSVYWPESAAKQSDFSDLPECDAEKIIVGFRDPTEYARLGGILPSSLYMEVANGKVALIMHRNATKWKGVLQAAQVYGILPEEMIAFGDDNGDVEMLTMCGTGVAMANAIPEAKAAGDAVTLTNDEDGVAEYLNKYVL